jgi:glycosyltransferase involved in cell wall biosynthesis
LVFGKDGILKILFIARQLNIGGAERQLVTLANELAARGHEIVIASYYPGGALSKKLDTSRVRLISLDKRSRWDIFSFCYNVIRVVRREKPAVVHGWMYTQNVIATIGKIFNPKVKLFWCIRSSNLSDMLDWLENTTVWVQNRLSGLADCVVVNSQAGLEYAVSDGIPRQKLRFIPNGIDTDLFYPDLAERQRVRAEWGVTDSEKIVGNVSRFDPIKNHPFFLRAAAKIAAEYPNVRFVCVGHGKATYLESLQAQARSLGIADKVMWVQARPDIRAMYNALDVFCSTSLSEGFPNVIGEAMACGRRCVVTDVGDSKLLVDDTGAAVASNDIEALAAALRHELEAPEALNLAARQHILDNFTVAHLAERTEETLASFFVDSPRFTKASTATLSGAGPTPTAGDA